MTTSVLAARRKTLYELNTKITEYKKKPTIFETNIVDKVSSLEQRQQPARRRFQSTTVQNSEKENQHYTHPVTKYINNIQSVTDDELKKFSSFLYKGAKYSINLKQPSAGYIEKRKLSVSEVSLPGEGSSLFILCRIRS